MCLVQRDVAIKIPLYSYLGYIVAERRFMFYSINELKLMTPYQYAIIRPQSIVDVGIIIEKDPAQQDVRIEGTEASTITTTTLGYHSSRCDKIELGWYSAMYRDFYIPVLILPQWMQAIGTYDIVSETLILPSPKWLERCAKIECDSLFSLYKTAYTSLAQTIKKED